MNKDELMLEIDKLPEFRFRDAAVDDKAPDEPVPMWIPTGKEWRDCRPVAFVSDRYKLVQHKDLLKPIVEPIPMIADARLVDYGGWAIMDIYPEGEEFTIDAAAGDRIGIRAYNSVDRTGALNVKFIIRHGGRALAMPTRAQNYRKIHVGFITEQTADYTAMIAGVRAAWNEIVMKFTQIVITPDNFEAYCNAFDCSPAIIKDFKQQVNTGSVYNLWDLAMAVFDKMGNYKFKSDVHETKRLEQFADSIFSQAFLLKLVAASDSEVGS
jgi:hypothetical protein